MSGVPGHIFWGDKLVELVGGGSVVNGAYPVKFFFKNLEICDHYGKLLELH